MRQKILGTVLPVAAAILLAVFMGFQEQQQQQQQQNQTPQNQIQNQMKSTVGDVNSLISNWSSDAKSLALNLVQKYGQPDEASDMKLVWRDKGPFKMTEVLNEEIPHNFPTPHNDIVQQSIDYKVPVDKISDLAKFDGSIIVDRTKGTLSARSASEAQNILALNLAKDIIDGKRDVEAARTFFAEAVENNQHPEYMKDLAFNISNSRGINGDPDVSIKLNEGSNPNEMKNNNNDNNNNNNDTTNQNNNNRNNVDSTRFH